MSFCSDVKDEITGVYPERKCCKKALLNGAFAFFNTVGKDKIKMNTESESVAKYIAELVSELFCDYIPLAIGRSENIARKPAPDMLELAMKQLGSDPDSTVYVGDSEVDVETSINAGVDCVGCLWGFRDRETLESAGAEYIISSTDELVGLIEKL